MSIGFWVEADIHAVRGRMNFRKRRKAMRKMSIVTKEDVMRQVPSLAQKLVKVAIENNPEIIGDLSEIVRMYLCRPVRPQDFIEHVVALVASELPGADRLYLRSEAFGVEKIDGGEKDFHRTTITELERHEDGWSYTMSDGWSAWVGLAADGYEPQVGSEVWQFMVNFNCVLGVVIDGHVFRYKTITQDRAEALAEKERRRVEERAKFPKHDAAIAKLPEIFQQRIQKFQRAPFFREDLESYEIFVCEQAVLFAERLETVPELIKWADLRYEEQAKLIPELEAAGHSGNTFGMACFLAKLYLESPEKILEVTGALAPLVGSNAYLPLEERVES